MVYTWVIIDCPTVQVHPLAPFTHGDDHSPPDHAVPPVNVIVGTVHVS